jgi:hypothetical protein
MAQETLEQRVTALEAEVAALKQRVTTMHPGADWLEHLSGSMKDYPEFEEVVRLGREIRRADSPEDPTDQDRSNA